MNDNRLVACLALSASLANCSAAWRVDGDTARAVAITASDGASASLEVRCGNEPQVTLTHPALAAMPTDEDGRLDWSRGALIRAGWNLNLTRPDHLGHLGIWLRCDERDDCVRPGPTDVAWIVGNLRTSWSWFIRIEPPERTVVDIRVSLAGSAAAIDAVCPSPDSDSPKGASREQGPGAAPRRH